jgi:hypothetical protein
VDGHRGTRCKFDHRQLPDTTKIINEGQADATEGRTDGARHSNGRTFKKQHGRSPAQK